jgi:GDP-L-fucose synthase
LDREARILVAGGGTLIGSALRRELRRQDYTSVVAAAEEPDYTAAESVARCFAAHRPEYVFVVAGRSGGIGLNRKYPVDLMQHNLRVLCHVLDAAHRYEVKKLLTLASSCCYPKACSQPMRPEALLNGALEPTSEAFAMARLAGITLCRAYRQQHQAHFISGIPADVFGPGDKFDREDSHVIGALIVKMHTAKQRGQTQVELWGTGSPRREFLYADDLADACLFAMQHYDGDTPLNLGGGTVLSIREVAEQIREVVGYEGALVFDTSRPDGAPLKTLDSSRLLEMGWQPRTPLREALAQTYRWFLEQQGDIA